jgi:hypothetical protein
LATDWHREEVEATVADYFEMLAAELRRLPYSKTEHRRRLRPLLRNRSDGSVEFKHQNISAALIRIGFPYISGYKPRWNYQRPLLDEVIAEQLATNASLRALAQTDAERSVTVPTVQDFLDVLTTPPEKAAKKHAPLRQPLAVYSPSINYLELEARNRNLGSLGEMFVLNFERARLMKLKCERLAGLIEHISKTKGDSAGFDILSFEATGEDRLIEVKTTKYGRETPFFVSRNELQVSEKRPDQYQLYRLFSFESSPHLFTLRGSLRATCALDPSVYIATVA